LRAYVFGESPDAERQIDALLSISSRVVTRRLGHDAWRGFCRGLEITLTLADEQFAGSSPVLLASVLSRFFALQAHLNAFTELVLKRDSREEVWKRWPPTAGERALL
jgi:type VI secretion system protein ImpG